MSKQKMDRQKDKAIKPKWSDAALLREVTGNALKLEAGCLL